MIRLKYFFTWTLCFFVLSTNAQKINPNWKSELNKSVEEFKNCTQVIEDGINSCSKYTGESVNTVYQVNDFYSEDNEDYLSGAEIIKILESSTQWKKLGLALIQEVLNEAQNNANANKAVVAVYVPEDGIGHIALILPGELTPSGSWGLNTPNSASFFMNDQQRSYSEKGLSYAFSKSMLGRISLFVRIY